MVREVVLDDLAVAVAATSEFKSTKLTHPHPVAEALAFYAHCVCLWKQFKIDRRKDLSASDVAQMTLLEHEHLIA